MGALIHCLGPALACGPETPRYGFTTDHHFRGVGVLRFFRRWLERPPAAQDRSGLFAGTDREPRVSLTAATVIAAHLAGCDGTTNEQEVAAFARLFRFPPAERTRYAQLFAQNVNEVGAFQPFVVQLVQGSGLGSSALEDLLERLYHLAIADGSLTTAECAFLDQLCDAFGLPGYWRRMDAVQPQRSDPYRVLGILRDASDAEVRAAFRRLTRQHHPDAVAARGDVPADDDAMAAINEAYRRVMRARRRSS